VFNLQFLFYCLLKTFWTETFKPDLLATNDESFMWAFCHRQRDFHQAVRVAAVRAREMGMALVLGTVICQLVVLRPFVQKGLMDEPDLKQPFESSVNCDFVEMLFAGEPGDFFLAQRLACLDQYFEYGHSAPGAVKLSRLEHLACLGVQVFPGHFLLQSSLPLLRCAA